MNYAVDILTVYDSKPKLSSIIFFQTRLYGFQVKKSIGVLPRAVNHLSEKAAVMRTVIVKLQRPGLPECTHT